MTLPDPIPYQMSEVPAEVVPPAQHGGDILSLISGILALLCLATFRWVTPFLGARLLLLFLGFLFAVVAIVSGHIAFHRLRAGRGLAIAGLVLGYIAIAVLLFAVIGSVIVRLPFRRRLFRRFGP
jgi:hypothetical protein